MREEKKERKKEEETTSAEYNGLAYWAAIMSKGFTYHLFCFSVTVFYCTTIIACHHLYEK